MVTSGGIIVYQPKTIQGDVVLDAGAVVFVNLDGFVVIPPGK